MTELQKQLNDVLITGEQMKGKSIIILLAVLILLLVLFGVIAARTAKSSYDKMVAEESFESPDFYSMQEFCSENASVAMEALKSGDTDKIEEIMLNSEGLTDVADYADWGNADFENAVSLGAGSLTAGLDDDVQMDISERFVVSIGDKKFVLFIETVTSRYGLNNEGVSAIGVTSYEHYDSLDAAWNGEKDDYSALAGELYWNSAQ